MLDRGRHPAFIGRGPYGSSVKQGGVWIYRYAGKDVATSLINPRLNCLNVLSVMPDHRSHGVGSTILRLLNPSFIRSTAGAVPYFEQRGFTVIGKRYKGRSLTTRIMVKKALFGLAGRISRIYGKPQLPPGSETIKA